MAEWITVNTLIVCVILGCSQFCKKIDAHLWRKPGNVLYYILLAISLIIAVLKDLHIPLTLPAEWMNSWWNGWGERIMGGG
jgi:hypothetical protein